MQFASSGKQSLQTSKTCIIFYILLLLICLKTSPKHPNNFRKPSHTSHTHPKIIGIHHGTIKGSYKSIVSFCVGIISFCFGIRAAGATAAGPSMEMSVDGQIVKYKMIKINITNDQPWIKHWTNINQSIKWTKTNQ